MIEDLTPGQRVARFDAQHGPGGERDEAWLYFPDGARRELNPMGALCEPPRDEAERCRLIAHYHRTIVNRLVRTFDDKKTLYTENASQYDHEECMAELKSLKAEITTAREALAEAEEAERYARTGRTREEEARYQQMEADHAAERERRRKELEGINV
ncbi:hypothetical protein [Algisphaera agarilytica]|uniref:Uncharacterized protein n=1 Tax=Algisphaera agarilytica TaxID=1385975 RepID=A0A7X0H972_9BACT|nr:hypothetical protein [Algisphaera agarilytica]MBB6431546.1 hypothetical protein [Algisphaera agarilytica]